MERFNDYWMLEFKLHIQRLLDMGFSYHRIAREVWGLKGHSYAHWVMECKGPGTPLAYERYQQLLGWMHDCEAMGAKMLYEH